MRPSESEGRLWWLPHLFAGVVCFSLGGLFYVRVIKRGELLQYWFAAALLSAIVGVVASVWYGKGFWSALRRFFRLE